MKRLEVSAVVRHIYMSLGFKRLSFSELAFHCRGLGSVSGQSVWRCGGKNGTGI